MASEPSGHNNYHRMSEVEQEIVYNYFYANDKHDLVMLVINWYTTQQDLDEIVKDYLDNMRYIEHDGLYPETVIAFGP